MMNNIQGMNPAKLLMIPITIGSLLLLTISNFSFTCHAFSTNFVNTFHPSKPKFGLKTTASSPNKSPNFYYTTSSTTSSSSSSLNMGVMEDFLSGTDNETRKKENDKYLTTLNERVSRINALEADIEELGDDELAAKTKEFRKRLQDGEDINGPILEEAFAVVREAAW